MHHHPLNLKYVFVNIIVEYNFLLDINYHIVKNKTSEKPVKIIENTKLTIDEILVGKPNNIENDSSKIEITREFAESLLSKRAIVMEAGIFEDPITVGNVSFGKIDPETREVTERFYWENADGTPNLERPYAIVNLQAMTEEQFAKAEEFLENGEFEKAVGKEAGGLSMRMNVDDVIKAGITRGSVVKCTFNIVMNREGEDILSCTAIAPMIARGGVNRFKQARIEAQKVRQEVLVQKTVSEKNNEAELKIDTFLKNKIDVTKLTENQKAKLTALQKALKTFKENYEQKSNEKVIITNSLLFTNYSSNFQKTNSYPIVRIPKLGTIIRSYQIGKQHKRGFKEEVFQQAVEKYFGTEFTILGDARINTGKQTRPYEPDIAMIDTINSNLRIDIEIDEPYAGITRQPTHCENEDVVRDMYFTDRGWLVIRFSEYQVHTQELECLRFIADIIKLVNPKYTVPDNLKNVLKIKDEKFWDIIQAQKWEKVNYREKYLNHIFQFISEKSEKFISDLTKQEQTEENLVKSTYIGKVDSSLANGFNLKNKHLRDERIKFYPEPHVYIVDNVPIPSVSSVISKFFPEFDSIYWARKKAIEKLELRGSELIESNIHKEAGSIAKKWKDKAEKAAKEGSYLHKQIENYYLGQEYIKTEEFDLFEDFNKDNPGIKPYRTEWRIFDEEYNIAGTIDLISKNNNSFEIYDWKRSKKIVDAYTGELIKENKWQKGIGQLSEVEDTSYSHYCLQQSLYKYILEKNYAVKISNMYLIVLHPDYDSYHKVEVPYLKSEIEYILKSL